MEIQDLKELIATREATEQWEIDRFIEEVRKSPEHALKWSGGVFMVAARQFETALVKRGVQALEEGTKEAMSLFQVVQEQQLYNLPNQLGGSTSSTYDLINRAKAVVAVDWVNPSSQPFGSLARSVQQFSEERRRAGQLVQPG